MQEIAKSEGFYQREHGALLREIAQTLGRIAGDNNAEEMTWLVDHIAMLVQTATEQMTMPDDADSDSGGSAIPLQ